jgi:hypothetical protein
MGKLVMADACGTKMPVVRETMQTKVRSLPQAPQGRCVLQRADAQESREHSAPKWFTVLCVCVCARESSEGEG